MLKALEILRRELDAAKEIRVAIFIRQGKQPEGAEQLELAIKKLELAITELETLENRSCDNCLYFSNSGHGFGLCNKGVSSDFKIGTFYCNKWEVKNECS